MSTTGQTSPAAMGSVAALKQGLTAGFIGYPTRYEMGDRPENQFIHGVDQAGESFTLRLTIPQKFLEAAKKKKDVIIPDIFTLSETHRKASNPCFADAQNGPITFAGGVFLAEQVQVVDAAKNLLSCNWLSVLRDQDQTPKPRMGIGYLEVNGFAPPSALYEEKKARLIEMNGMLQTAQLINKDVEDIDGVSVLEYSAERDQLALDLFQCQKQWFIGVDVQYQRLDVLNLQNEASVRRTILELIESNSNCGMYGGVIMRPVKEVAGVREVQVDSIRRINHQFDYKAEKIPDVSSLWDAFVGRGAGWMKSMKSKGCEVEIIPIQRVNCGPISNEKYAKEFAKGGVPKQIKAFVDKRFYHAPYVNFANQNAYLACPIAMRTADTRAREYRESNTILLSSIHAYGKAIGNALELDRHGQRTLKLSAIPEPFVRQTRGSEPTYG
jgi:hypothetical protein